MRKLIAVLLLCTFPGYCALPSTLQWDVRTTGVDTNGGAFDPSVASPGTDYSQQNSAQIAYTDLVISATTTNYTSVGNAVTSAVVGNTIQIISGTNCTTGFYNVRSETAGSPNFATVDRSMGTAASVCTANLGGGLLTLTKAFANIANSNTVNLKTGTYTQTTTLNFGLATLLGYNSTHGDGGTKPLVTTATNSTDLLDLSLTGTNNWTAIDNVQFSNTAGTSANGLVKTAGSSNAAIRNCKLSGFTNAINGDNSGAHYEFNNLIIANTEIATNLIGIINDASNGGHNVTILPGTYIHNNTTYGIQGTNNSSFFISGAVIDTNGYGLFISGGATTVTGSVLSNSTHDGMDLQGTGSFGYSNTILYGNGGYGANVATSMALSFYTTNAYGTNTSGSTNGITPALTSSQTTNDVALASCNPFVGAPNFALSACGLTALQAKGFGVTPFGSSYPDIGAVQSKATASGGGGAYVQ